MVFCRQAVLAAAIQRSGNKEQHISKRNDEITVAQEIHISRLELQRKPFEFSQLWKVNIFCGNITPSNKILISKERLCMSNMDFIFDTDQAQINSVYWTRRTLRGNHAVLRI